MPATTPASTRQTLHDLVLGVIANRPAWLAVCRWCLGVIYQPTGNHWHHVHRGIVFCPHPLPGAPLYAAASPLTDDERVAQIQRLLPHPTPPVRHRPPRAASRPDDQSHTSPSHAAPPHGEHRASP